MELIDAPAGANIFAHRGANNYVRIQGTQLFAALGPVLPIVLHAANTSPTVPHHIVEAVYARAFSLSAGASARLFGDACVGVGAFVRLENALLAANFDFSPAASIGVFVRRLTQFLETMTSDALVLQVGDLLDLEPAGPVDNDHWLGRIAFGSLVDSAGRMSVYGELAALTGPRYTEQVRAIAQRARYS